MLITFQLDTDFSTKYLKSQITDITNMMNSLYEKKVDENIYESEDDDDKLESTKVIKKRVGKIKLLNLNNTTTEPPTIEAVPDNIAPVVPETKPSKIICECGGSFILRNKNRHEKTKSHIDFINLKCISNK